MPILSIFTNITIYIPWVISYYQKRYSKNYTFLNFTPLERLLAIYAPNKTITKEIIV